MAVESNAWAHAAQQPLEGGFTRLDRLAPQILAIKVKVEIAKRYGSIVLTSADSRSEVAVSRLSTWPSSRGENGSAAPELR
jgi:hypothetical protein